MEGCEISYKGETVEVLDFQPISIEQNENTIKFNVLGYGHGVGMSQTGADSLAKQGKSWEEIIKHFYVGVEIEEISSNPLQNE